MSHAIQLLNTNLTARQRTTLLLGCLIFVGLILRIWAIGFDLPNVYHPDEDALVSPAMNIIKTGDFTPTRMEYGTLHIYLLALVYMGVFLLSFRNGDIAGVDQLIIFERGAYPGIFPHPEYVLAGRVVSAFMSTAIIFLVFLLAWRLTGRNRPALLATAIVAFHPRLITHAHYTTPETPLFFWITLALYLLIRSYDERDADNGWAFAGAGFVCGLAASTKYNGVLLTVPLLAFALLRVKDWEDVLRWRVVSGPLAMGVGFFAGTPYALITTSEFLGWFGYALRLYSVPRELALPSWLWHLRYHVTSTHALIFLLSGLGAWLSLRRVSDKRFKCWAILGGYVVLVWVAVFGQTNQQARMWLPAGAVMLVWSGVAADWLWTQATSKLPNRRQLAYLVPTIVLLPIFIASVYIDRLYTLPDVRTTASEWVVENIPAGTPIAVDYFAPNLDPNAYPITKIQRLYWHDVAWYQEGQFQYLIMTEAITQPDELAGQDLADYEQLTSELCLVHELEGSFLTAPSFAVWIYQVPPCP